MCREELWRKTKEEEGAKKKKVLKCGIYDCSVLYIEEKSECVCYDCDCESQYACACHVTVFFFRIKLALIDRFALKLSLTVFVRGIWL